MKADSMWKAVRILGWAVLVGVLLLVFKSCEPALGDELETSSRKPITLTPAFEYGRGGSVELYRGLLDLSIPLDSQGTRLKIRTTFGDRVLEADPDSSIVSIAGRKYWLATPAASSSRSEFSVRFSLEIPIGGR